LSSGSESDDILKLIAAGEQLNNVQKGKDAVKIKSLSDGVLETKAVALSAYTDTTKITKPI
jgi:hypothetical protein